VHKYLLNGMLIEKAAVESEGTVIFCDESSLAKSKKFRRVVGRDDGCTKKIRVKVLLNENQSKVNILY
jgi:hypothetical protein